MTAFLDVTTMCLVYLIPPICRPLPSSILEIQALSDPTERINAVVAVSSSLLRFIPESYTTEAVLFLPACENSVTLPPYGNEAVTSPGTSETATFFSYKLLMQCLPQPPPPNLGKLLLN
jgi:hypothetical protein